MLIDWRIDRLSEDRYYSKMFEAFAKSVSWYDPTNRKDLFLLFSFNFEAAN